MRRVLEWIVVAMGVALVAVAVLADQRFLDRHFLPSFFVTHRDYVLRETMARIAIGLLGVLVALFARRPLAHALTRSPARAGSVALAAVLALGASECALRYGHLRPA